MVGFSAGEAAGVAASLAVIQGKADVREVMPAHIRYVLQLRGQFTEGEVERIPLPASPQQEQPVSLEPNFKSSHD